MSIPQTWVYSTLGDTCYPSQYGWTTKATSQGTGTKFLRTTDISAGTIDWTNVPYCQDIPDDVDRYLLRDGDIVISRAGSIGLSALIGHAKPSVFASYLIRFRPYEELSPKYVAYFLQSPKYWAQVRSQAAGIALQNINAKKLSTVEIPIAPRQEQDRIVAEIEKQFTRLDDSVSALKRVQTNLQRYRASVLNAACEGRLVPTEAELALKEKRSYEPASELLKLILADRRAKWEADQVAKMIAAGKPPKNDEWKKKYKEPAAPQTGLPPLPRGWAWATVDQLSQSVRNGISAKPDQAEGLAILRISAVRPLSVDLEDIRFLKDDSEFEEYAICEGDLLFTRYNGNRDFVGVCGRVPTLSRKTVHPDKLIRVVPLLRECAAWIEIAANYGISREHLASRIRTTAGQSGISGDDLKKTPVPLPPLTEQSRIASQVDRALTAINAVTSEMARGETRATRLKHAVLRAAFSGNLVNQDPADEPASILLNRIHGEREKQAERKKVGRAKKVIDEEVTV